MEENPFSYICRLFKEQSKNLEKQSKNNETLTLEDILSVLCENEDIAKEIMQFISRSKFKLIKKDKNALENFKIGALEDLKAAELLYEAGIYSLSVYHLQQAVEKLSKYWLISNAKSTYDKLRYCGGHNTLKPYIDMIYEFLRKLRKAITERLGENAAIISKIDSFMEGLKNSYDSSDIILTKYNEIEQELLRVDKIKISLSNEVKEFLEKDDFAEDFPSRIFTEMRILLEKSINILYLIKISRYTDAHQVTARYYEGDLDFGPCNYKKGLGIVDAIPLILEKLKIVAKSILEEAPEDDGMGRV